MATIVELTAPNGVVYKQPVGLFINNEFVQSSDGATFPTINASNEEEIALVHSASEKDVDTAVAAARKAFEDPSWRDMDPSDRGRLLFKLADLVEENAKVLATIETWDSGHPWADSFEGDVPEFARTIRYYGGFADKIHGETVPVGPTKLAYTVREPLGVCGQIIPWNYPLGMACWKLGPALAAGNTIILKPAEQTPLSILFIASLIVEASFPPGVVNIINGPGAVTGAAIAGHPGIDKVAFTGSTGTAKIIMKLAANNLKNITLETGGKSPLVVFADADLEQAAKWAVIGIMSNAGQICTATSRLLIESSIHDKFTEAFKAEIASMSVIGDPFDEETSQGPQISKAQYDRILSYIDSANTEGATLLCGGKPTDIGTGKGYFIAPTVFTNVQSSMTVYREEIFGPFAVVSTFTSDEEALKMANDSTYGLGAAVFTRDIERAYKFANKVESGMVWINSSNDADYRVPFGGVKQSGIGRECGEAGLSAYSNVKSIYVNLGSRI